MSNVRFRVFAVPYNQPAARTEPNYEWRNGGWYSAQELSGSVATTLGSFKEFWAALTRLDESTLRREANQKQSDEHLKQLTERIDRLVSTWQQRWPSLARLLASRAATFALRRELNANRTVLI